jgi:hypothetical protein
MGVVKKYGEVLLNVIVTSIIGVISCFVVEKEIGIVIGLTAFILFSLTSIMLKLDVSNNLYKSLLSMFSGYLSQGSFKEVVIKQTLSTLDNIKDTGIWANSEDYMDLWQDCINSSQRSWMVTNYIRIDKLWRLAFSEKVMNVQRSKILSGQKISRLFIFDSIEERNEMTDILVKQTELGVEVRWLLKKDIPNSPIIKSIIKEIGTIDFAIVDDSWVVRFFLDRDRKISKINAIYNSGLTERAKVLIGELMKIASIYSINV